jgi:hypothetical protein
MALRIDLASKIIFLPFLPFFLFLDKAKAKCTGWKIEQTIISVQLSYSPFSSIYLFMNSCSLSQ